MRNQKLYSISEAAERLDVTTGRLRQLCLQDRIHGAFKLAGVWAIPAPIRIYASERASKKPCKLKMKHPA